MLSKIHAFLKRWLPVLFEDKMPVWLTIAVGITAAGATYVLAPAYNRQFALQDVRNGHIEKATDRMNDEIIQLSQKIRKLNTAYVNGKTASVVTTRDECLDMITKMQWQLVDLQVLLSDPEDQKLVQNLGHALTLLRSALNSPADKNYTDRIGSAMEPLSTATRDVLSRLYTLASLRN